MRPVKISTLSFEQAIESSHDIPLLCVFGGWYDMKSRWLFDRLEILADRYDGKIRAAIVDIDYTTELFWDCNITEVPTIILYEDGKELKRQSGCNSSYDLDDMIDYLYGVYTPKRHW